MIHADQLRARLQRRCRLALVVHLDQRRQPVLTRHGQQLTQAFPERGGDQQHGVSAQRLRLQHLVGVDDEVLTENRQG